MVMASRLALWLLLLQIKDCRSKRMQDEEMDGQGGRLVLNLDW